MKGSESVGEKFIRWAQNESQIRGLVQIGSRVRLAGTPGAADAESDWDFQIVADDVVALEERGRLEKALGEPALAFVVRGGRLGVTRKITAVFATGGLDVVLLPTAQVAAVQAAVRAGQSEKNPAVMQALMMMAAVLSGGYQVLKGDDELRAIFAFTSTQVPAPRLSDQAAIELAEGFVCDFVATRRLIARGELIAAQRWLHQLLAETNFRLLHEYRLRKSEISFPDARRIESFDREDWGKLVTVNSNSDRKALSDALVNVAAACCELMKALVGSAWSWPDVEVCD